MWSYLPPLRDMRFVIEELLAVQGDWRDIPHFAELDADIVPQILEEAGKFASDTLAPTNATGDVESARLVDGRVVTPRGFVEAYRQYCAAGWPALACDAGSGGQGLPQLVNAALYEMLNATNHAWTMYPGLAHGAFECIRAHGTAQIRELYLPKIVSGEWLATMCLTEPQAGSDVGLLRTTAEPVVGGAYAITGSKIFISGGDHDLTENIVHLVLARLPDAPAGTRGISLFVVPKFLPDAAAGVAPASAVNGVRVDGLEKKMGIKGSATCVLRFEGATGWLIGEPNRGLAAMFVMMNAARLHVGLQGLGHAEMAYQNAWRYAAERRQMRAAPRAADNAVGVPAAARAAPSPGGASLIIEHPAVRRALLTLRAFVEGERALAYWAAHLLDVAEHHPDAARRRAAHDLVSLLTPVVKAFLTDNGFVLSSAALQVWGGYGYIHDFGIEQTVRDSRIAMIYEGTNEIQAVDLLVRKILSDGGAKFQALLDFLAREAAECAGTAAAEMGGALADVRAALGRETAALVAEAAADPELAHRVASDYLRLVGLALLGALWARAARLAAPLAATDAFYRMKMSTACFYFDHLWPETEYRLQLLARGRRALPLLDALD